VQVGRKETGPALQTCSLLTHTEWEHPVRPTRVPKFQKGESVVTFLNCSLYLRNLCLPEVTAPSPHARGPSTPHHWLL